MLNFNIKKFKKYKTEVINYLIAGFFLNILGFIIYCYLTIKLEIKATISITILYLIMIPIYFISQNFFVFKKNNIKKMRILKFSINLLIFYILNIILIFILTEKLNFDQIISQFLILILLITLNFFSQKNLIFNKN